MTNRQLWRRFVAKYGITRWIRIYGDYGETGPYHTYLVGFWDGAPYRFRLMNDGEVDEALEWRTVRGMVRMDMPGKFFAGHRRAARWIQESAAS